MQETFASMIAEAGFKEVEVMKIFIHIFSLSVSCLSSLGFMQLIRALWYKSCAFAELQNVLPLPVINFVIVLLES